MEDVVSSDRFDPLEEPGRPAAASRTVRVRVRCDRRILLAMDTDDVEDEGRVSSTEVVAEQLAGLIEEVEELLEANDKLSADEGC